MSDDFLTKSELEAVQEELDTEVEEWTKMGMHPEMTSHSNESLWIMRMQIQTIFHMLGKKEIATEDEMTLAYKKIMLADMKNMRKQALEQRREALVPESKLILPKDLKI